MRPPIRDMMPFLPRAEAGQEISMAFYEALGFEKTFGEVGGVCGYRSPEGFEFLLSYNENQNLGENLMMRARVLSAQDWYDHLVTLDLPTRFPGVKVAEPSEMPWGWLITYVWDPAGVLWHFGEPNTPENRAYFGDEYST